MAGETATSRRATDDRRPARRTTGDFRRDTRSVQWTLEAFLAVLLLLSAVVVVAQVVPTGTQQAEAEIAQTQLQAAGDDVLAIADAGGTLHEAVLYWNATEGAFPDRHAELAAHPHYVTFDGEDDHPLAGLLAATLEERNVAYNVHLEFDTPAGPTQSRPLVYQGPPGGDSVVTSTTVVLADDDEPHASAGDCTLGEIDAGECDGETFYASNVDPDAEQFNPVRVVIELWRV